MGDRANVVIENAYNPEKVERVYLYSHWDGERIIKHAIAGLKSGRVGDPSYLARIIFCSLVAEDVQGETGYGISASITDNEHPVFVISEQRSRGTLVYFEGGNWGEAFKRVTPRIAPTDFLHALGTLAEEKGKSIESMADENELYGRLIRLMNDKYTDIGE